MSQTKAQLVSGLSINASAPATSLNIDSSGRVLVGTSTGDTKLYVYDATAPQITLNNGTSSFIVGNNSGGNNHILYGTGAYPVIVYTDSTERARIDSSGRLLIGTSSAVTTPTGSGAAQLMGYNNGGTRGITVGYNEPSSTVGPRLALTKSRANNTTGFDVVSSGDEIGIVSFQGGDGSAFIEGARIAAYVDGTPGANDMPGRLVFSTTADGASSPTERARLDSNGTYWVYSVGSDTYVSGNSAGAGTSQQLFTGVHSRTSTTSGGTVSVRIYNNGNIQNTNGSYTTLSDAKLKENIVDAGSQWDDLKAIRIRKWNFKEETGHETHRQLGPIAQELEQVCPGLVFETADRDEAGNETGEVTKGVNQSVLYMKAVKALQEAMERIEQLEASNADLLARVTALEAS